MKTTYKVLLFTIINCFACTRSIAQKNDNAPPAVINVNNDAGKCYRVLPTQYYFTGTTPIVYTITYSGATVDTITTSNTSVTTQFNVGVTNARLIASNTCGADTTYYTITISDAENPSITAPNAVTVNADSGNCSATNVTLGTPTTSDNCVVDSVWNNAPSAFPIGTNTVTWTVKDIHGNTATDTQTVYVKAPEIQMLDTVVFSTRLVGGHVTLELVSVKNSGDDTLYVDSLHITGPDSAYFHLNPNDSTQFVVPPNFQASTSRNSFRVYFPAPSTVGAYYATLLVYSNDCDENPRAVVLSGRAICKPPRFVACPTDTVVTAAQGQCGRAVNYVTTVTGTSLSTSTTHTFSGATTGSGIENGSGSIFNIGVTHVQLVMTNPCGSDTCSFTVTVTDNQTPTITAPANVVTSVDSTNYCSASNVTLGTPTTADNCGVDSVWNNAPTSFPIGTTTILWTVTDIHGNTATDTQTVHVKAPNISAIDTFNYGSKLSGAGGKFRFFDINNIGDTTLTIDSLHIIGQDSASFKLGNFYLPISLSAPSPYGGSTFTVPSFFTGNTIGTHHATLLVYSNDCDENPFAVPLKGTVLCNPAQITSCPSNMVVSPAQGTCGNTVTYNTNVSGGPTPSVSYTFSGATTGSGSGTGSGSTFYIGTTNVQVIATNACGSDTCNFTVTVTGPDIDVADVAYGGYKFYGNSWNPAPRYMPISNKGDSVLTISNLHITGSDSAYFFIDSTLSIPFTVSANSTKYIKFNFIPDTVVRMYYATLLIYNDDCDESIDTVSMFGELRCAAPYIQYQSNITANAAQGQCSNTVTYNLMVNGGPNTFTYSLSGATTGSGTGDGSGSTFNVGVTTVQVTASSYCNGGTSYTRSFTITVNDTEAPTITTSDITVNADSGACTATSVSLGTPTTVDNCGVDSVWNNAPSSYPVGTTAVTWIVSDIHGNTDTAIQTVTVIDNQNPTIACPADVTVNADNGQCTAANVTLGTPTTSDNCGVDSVWNNAPSSYSVGTTTVTWTVTDIHGNSSTCTQTVTVIDNQNPTIVCPADVTVNADNGQCTAANVSFGTPTTSDNCGVDSVWNNAPTSFSVGNTTVTWTVTDIHGNSSTCTQTVTVIDNQNPTIACPADVTVNADSGQCAATGVTLGTPTTTDNCGVDSVWNNAPANYPVGTTTVTWYVIDIHGNSSTCTQTVTVIDNQAPIVVCKNYTVTLSGGTATISPSDVDNGSTDNCGIETMSLSKSTFTCADAGSNQVVLKVYDIHGNSASCTATVTVPAAPSVSVTTTPANNTYTGGNPNHIFLGYGPQSATITATGTGGNNFTYSWNPATGLSNANVQSPVFTPTAAGNYTYTVTATNSGGCSATSTVSFCVLDVQEYKNNGSLSGKIYVCITKNNGQQTKAVQPSKVAGYLQSGDRLGKCEESCGSAAKGGKSTETGTDDLQELSKAYELKIYPNPNSGTFKVELPETINDGVMIIRDMMGKEVKRFSFVMGQDMTFRMTEVADGMYMVDITNGDEIHRARIIIRR